MTVTIIVCRNVELKARKTKHRFERASNNLAALAAEIQAANVEYMAKLTERANAGQLVLVGVAAVAEGSQVPS